MKIFDSPIEEAPLEDEQEISLESFFLCYRQKLREEIEKSLQFFGSDKESLRVMVVRHSR